MLKCILIGVIIIGVTISIHATGTSVWMWAIIKRYAGRDGLWKPRKRWPIFFWTATVLLTLHMIEVFLWALTYLILPAAVRLSVLEEAVYFSLLTYTTLGYGDITLPPGPRLLSGLEAMSGILLFGWSAAVFYAVIRRGWKVRY